MHSQVQSAGWDQDTPGERNSNANIHWIFVSIGCKEDDRKRHRHRDHGVSWRHAVFQGPFILHSDDWRALRSGPTDDVLQWLSFFKINQQVSIQQVPLGYECSPNTNKHGERPDIDDSSPYGTINIPKPEGKHWSVEDLFSQGCPELEEPVPVVVVNHIVLRC